VKFSWHAIKDRFIGGESLLNFSFYNFSFVSKVIVVGLTSVGSGSPFPFGLYQTDLAVF